MRRLRTSIAILAATIGFAASPAMAAELQPPRDVYAEATRADRIVLTWQSDNAAALGVRFLVLRDGKQIADTKEREFIDLWRIEQQRYTYVVRVVDDQGRSAEAGPIVVKTPSFRAGLELGPYLQQLSSKRVAVVWQTFSEATTALHFGPAGGAQATVKRDAGLTRRHVVIVSGLSPGTLYTYRWESEGRIGPEAQLRTPVSDQSQFSFGVIGDYGIGSRAAAANLRRLSEDTIDFAITTGDNAQGFGKESEYRKYVFGPLSDFLASRPFWPSIGNHDYLGLQNYLRYFVLPNGGRYYSFTVGGVLFVSLDSNRFHRRQRRWLQRTLRRSKARCKVAYFHHPLWSSGRGSRSGTRSRRRARFVPLLQRGGVDLVLNGHIQNYERSHRLRGRHRSRRGITYVVTGGGGARLSGFATRKRPRWSARRGAFHHRLRITAAKHILRGKAIDTRGNTRDRFRVRCR